METRHGSIKGIFGEFMRYMESHSSDLSEPLCTSKGAPENEITRIPNEIFMHVLGLAEYGISEAKKVLQNSVTVHFFKRLFLTEVSGSLETETIAN